MPILTSLGSCRSSHQPSRASTLPRLSSTGQRANGLATCWSSRGRRGEQEVILHFLEDFLDDHHGDQRGWLLTPNAQFHAGTVGTVTPNTNIGGLLTAANLRSWGSPGAVFRNGP